MNLKSRAEYSHLMMLPYNLGKIGDEIEENFSCNSEYMLEAMDWFGAAIRKPYYWIPTHQLWYLVMDNTGGHSTNSAISQYRSMLLDKYTIELIFQLPRSPCANSFNLRMWVWLHVFFERQNYLTRASTQALCSVLKTCSDGGLDVTITKVFDIIWLVLCNILEDGGGNE